MSKLEILVDVDGVLADFTSEVLATLHNINGINYTIDMVDQWHIEKALDLDRDDWAECVNHIQSPGFARNLKPYPGAIEAVKKLAEYHEVCFVTADWRGSPTWVFDRNHWLTDHFGPLGKKVVHTSHKYRVCGNVLIEDKPANIHQWAPRQKGSAILFDRPYNRSYTDDQGVFKIEGNVHYMTRVHDWEEALEAINKVKLL